MLSKLDMVEALSPACCWILRVKRSLITCATGRGNEHASAAHTTRAAHASQKYPKEFIQRSASYQTTLHAQATAPAPVVSAGAINAEVPRAFCRADTAVHATPALAPEAAALAPEVATLAPLGP